ncbi:MAG: SDR family NAD(P)-dependent oxidoreductase, partial [Spirochaetota bacterium]
AEGAAGALGERPRRVWTCEVDLAATDGPERLMDAVRAIEHERGDRVYGLVNNAGVTHYGPVARMPSEALHRILDLNVTATIDLSHRFLRHVLGEDGTAGGRRPPGVTGSDGRRRASRTPHAAILTVTSVAAHVPVAYQAVYAASKHALQGFSESLSYELGRLRRTGGPRIVVTAVSPGGIATEMIERSGLDDRFAGLSGGEEARSSFLAPASRVAAHAVRAWRWERRRSVPGLGNVLTVLAGRFLPRCLVGRAAERLYRP